MSTRNISRLAICVMAMSTVSVQADVKLPSIFGSHMVIQREQLNRIWGTAARGERITVKIGDQTHTTATDLNGYWMVKLDAMKAGGPYTMSIKGTNLIIFEDVMIGEVWVCSGQSNMQFAVSSADDADLEIQSAKYPNIRLISVPQLGTQVPQLDFVGEWQRCSPQTVASFSAVGYFFGRQLNQTLDIPIGLIDNAWGGSACEAWIRHDLFANDERYAPLLRKWDETVQGYNAKRALEDYQIKRDDWRLAVEKARAQGKPAPRPPRRPRNPLTGQHRPANLYNGVLKPIIGYGIRGVIWYQGETNASRAYQYRHMFPLMIQNWRDEWKQGDFSFYWVQLADFLDESPIPADSSWAELREAQTMTMNKLPNTGEAVIIGLGEAHDIHPKNKQGVAKRLARWALARDYGLDITHRSPLYKSMRRNRNKVTITFEHVGQELDTFDVRTPIGFTIAGADKKFVKAQAKIIGKDKMEVWSDRVSRPVAVRYAWANNPVCNLQNRSGLPATPFRTDDWPGVTIDNHR